MNPQPYTQNPYIGGTFLDSKFFNPDYLFAHIVSFFRDLFDFIFGNGGATGGITLLGIFTVFTIFFITVIAYCCVRLLEIRAKEKKHLAYEIAEYAQHHAEREQKKWGGEAGPKNERWGQILQYLFSTNEGDWKLAIIEADSMLDTLMDQLNFKGDTLGDKLKASDRDKFRNLTVAWEVHTIRNRIAHEGSAFEISQHEAKRVIALYEQIFREFGYI